MKSCCSPEFREYCLGRYPILSQREDYRKLFNYLAFGTFKDDSGRTVIPATVLARIEGKEPGSNYRGGKFLDSFRADVMPGLIYGRPYELDAYSFGPVAWSQCRVIGDAGFDQELQDRIEQEIRNFKAEGQVLFNSGKVYAVNKSIHRKIAQAEHKEKLTAHGKLNPTQEKILTYLHNQSGDAILKRVRSNLDGIKATIESLPASAKLSKKATHDQQYRILHSVLESPKVLYLPTKKTPRLHATEDSIIGFKSEVRKSATKGWFECDLRSSQFAILAQCTQSPAALAFLRAGEMSLWQHLTLVATSGQRQDPTPREKEVLKEFIYSLCFGKTIQNLQHLLNKNDLEKVWGADMVEELIRARTYIYGKLDQAGGATDIFGQWQAIKTDVPRYIGGKKNPEYRWAGSILASCIQAIEMRVIEPIFDVALTAHPSHEFDIRIFQHDGATFSIGTSNRADQVCNQLRDAVAARAKELDIKTTLEINLL